VNPRATHRRVLACAATVISAGLLLTACGGDKGGDDKGSAAGKGASAKKSTVAITITDKDCAPRPAKVPAGAVQFTVTNKNSAKVTEVELQDGSKMLGEKENLTPGLSGDFTLNLNRGTYSVYCPGADSSRTSFTVTGAAKKSWKDDPQLIAATQDYATWIDGEVKQLVTSTDAFTAAVKAGKIDQARTLYGRARVHYERIEPTAEIWGDLDGRIDGRIDDAATPADFTGFHRIEQAIWQKKSLAGMGTLADRLDADVNKLYAQVQTVEYQPAEIANGATDLVNEIQSSKITGEEERYSHIDLLDFQSNVEGSEQAFANLQPALTKIDPALAQSVSTAFNNVDTLLDNYRSASQPSGFVQYGTLTAADKTAAAHAVQAVAEPLSRVASKVVNS